MSLHKVGRKIENAFKTIWEVGINLDITLRITTIESIRI